MRSKHVVTDFFSLRSPSKYFLFVYQSEFALNDVYFPHSDMTFY